MSSSEPDQEDVGTPFHSETDEDIQEPDDGNEIIVDGEVEQEPDEENEHKPDENEQEPDEEYHEENEEESYEENEQEMDEENEVEHEESEHQSGDENELSYSGSDAPSRSSRSSVESDETNDTISSQQSNDSIVSQVQNISNEDVVNNLLTQVESDFRDICLDEAKLRRGAIMYLDRVIDFITLGLVFSVYRDIKMGAYSATVVRMEQMVEEKNEVCTDIFAEYYDKERKCVCSKCTKMVLASGFAMHLEICMGIPRGRTRNARRVVTTTSSLEKKSPSGESMPSSEEDNDDGDVDWSCGGDKRKKKRDRNGTKKFKGTRTKKPELEPNKLIELEDVDIEGVPPLEDPICEYDDDDFFCLNEYVIDDSSCTTVYSAGTQSNTSTIEHENDTQEGLPSSNLSS